MQVLKVTSYAIFLLTLSRAGTDKAGRQYTTTVTATDKIGNAGSCSAVVGVPHDQRQSESGD